MSWEYLSQKNSVSDENTGKFKGSSSEEPYVVCEENEGFLDTSLFSTEGSG